jgi:hypothetical protein
MERHRARLLGLMPALACALAVAFGLGGGVAGAQGVTGYSEPSASMNVPIGTTQTLTATCPAGDVVVGGGYQTNDATLVSVLQSQPSGDGAWEIQVQNANTNSTAPAAVTAVCVAGPLPGYSQQPASTMALPGQQGASVAASCPTGTEVVGGGFSNPFAVAEVSSLPEVNSTIENTTWTSVVNNNYDGGSTIAVTAICASTSLSGYSEPVTNAPVTTSTTVSQACPSGEVVLGGGFGGAQGTITSDQPTLGGAVSNNTWSVDVLNPAVEGASVTSVAVCADLAPTVTAVSPLSGPAGGGTSVTITGTNLTGATGVDFGTTASSSFTVDSATQITATVPAGSGTVDVTVSAPGGTSVTSAADQFTYAAVVPAPTAGQIGTSQATLSADVNPNGSQTTVVFEYGLDPKYGVPSVETAFNVTTPKQTLQPGAAPQPVTALVTGLVPDALYDARAVATSAGGTVVGPATQFTTAALPSPPPPVIGRSENVTPVSGKVFVKLPGSTHTGFEPAALIPAVASTGVGFVPLTEARQLPNGTEVDARAGTLALTDATTVSAKHKRPSEQMGDFSGGVFKITQSADPAQKGLTTMSLLDSGIFPGAPDYSACVDIDPYSLGRAVPHKGKPLSSQVLQTLNANEHGNFNTRGKFSAATVRGTSYSVSDRCDGTVTHVKHGVVTVTNFQTHRQITLHANQSYFAHEP